LEVVPQEQRVINQTEEVLKELHLTLVHLALLLELLQLVEEVVDLEHLLPALIPLVDLVEVVEVILVLIQVQQEILHQHHHHKEILEEQDNFLAQLYTLLVVGAEQLLLVEAELLQHLEMVVLDLVFLFWEVYITLLVEVEEEHIKQELQVVVE
jgi:hypothetical protein